MKDIYAIKVVGDWAWASSNHGETAEKAVEHWIKKTTPGGELQNKLERLGNPSLTLVVGKAVDGYAHVDISSLQFFTVSPVKPVVQYSVTEIKRSYA